MLSDFWPHGKIADLYGVLRRDGTTERAIFVIDPEGIIRDIDIHPINDQPDNNELFTILKQINGREVVKPVQNKADLVVPEGGIVMYCTRWCPDCRTAREWLAYHAIPYQEIDVNANPEAALYVKKLTGGPLVTPTFDIDGKYIFDFDEEKLKDVLL
ncbi:MAG: redoxin domain-containing protein [Anaerolineaceae bacterium]|nr:redoxin domain-containing protein [Anaerolineaceae bacterium]